MRPGAVWVVAVWVVLVVAAYWVSACGRCHERWPRVDEPFVISVAD